MPKISKTPSKIPFSTLRSFFNFPSYSQPLIKSHAESKIVPFSAQEMYDVVADVNRYKEFLPFCVDSRVLRKPNENVMDATLRIGFKVFTEAYTSRVIMNRPHKIVIKSLESPTFKRIESKWNFKQLEKPYSCLVNFHVTFEVTSFLHANAIKLFFEDVACTQLNAFIGRAGKIYTQRHRNDREIRQSLREDQNEPISPIHTAQNDMSKFLASMKDKSGKNKESGIEEMQTAEKAMAMMKNSICSKDYALLLHIFTKFAENEKRLYFSGFFNACRALGGDYDTLKLASENSVVAGAIFSSFGTSAEAKDWLNFEEFLVGVYLMTKGSVEEKAMNLFLTIDTAHDGKLNRQELEKAMQRRIHTVRRIFPKLLIDQINIQMQHARVTSLPSSAEELMSEGLEAMENLMEEIEKDIPLAVNEIFSQADLDADGYITENEWLVAWQSHPELVELMTIDGMQKIAQWASVVKPNIAENRHLESQLTYVD